MSREHPSLRIKAARPQNQFGKISFWPAKMSNLHTGSTPKIEMFKHSSAALRKTLPATQRSPISPRITADLLSFAKQKDDPDFVLRGSSSLQLA